MKDVQVRKTISMVGQPGLLLALALVILAAVGWLNYREMAASADAVSARRLMAAQLAGAILASLLLLGAFALLKRQILARHCRQTEEAIRQSEERLSLAIAAASLGTWDRIIPSDEVVWSPRCYELFGLSPNTPMTYQRFLEAVHPEDRDRIERAVRADVEQHEDHEVEMRVVWPDGTIHFVAERGHAYYDPSGRPTRILGVAMDITRRKQAEEAVRQSEERLSLAVAAANLGTWDWDMLSDELVWSPRRFELFGLIPEDPMTYQRYLEAIHPEDRDRVDRAARAAAERHEDFDIEMRTVWPDGTVHFVAGHGRAQYDSLGRPTRMIGVAMDITKRKQAEEAVRQSEERLSLAIAAADLGTWDRTIVPDEAVWSPRGLELFGLSSETPMSYQRFLEAVHPEDRDRIDRAVHAAYERHGDYDIEMRTVWPDGTVRFIASRGRPHFDPSGRPIRMSGVIMDITKRKQAENALRAAKEELARANQDLEEKVQHRTAKLREAMEEMEHMSYSMIHDMRAPLRAMHSFAMLLEEECAGGLPTQGLDYSRRIRESADRLDQLVTGALDYNKVVRQDLPVTPVEVGSLLRGMIETYPDLREPAAHVTIEFDELVVGGNQSLLTQCFGNLLGNAVKFVAPGVKPRVRVRAEPRGEAVRIWIEDNGICIPKDAQERIFGMFQRMHHESEYPGTGIGLAIVRKAVERMGGRLGLESEPGKGSKFWIELPNADEAEKRESGLRMQHEP